MFLVGWIAPYEIKTVETQRNTMKQAVSILYNTKSITVIPKREINLLYKSHMFILQLDYNN